MNIEEAIARSPTGDECNRGALLARDEHYAAYAAWYPQMGGYVGKAVVVVPVGAREGNSCFEAYVWHDGEFPFGDDRQPAHIHHCDADQFIEFGRRVNSWAESEFDGAKPGE